MLPARVIPVANAAAATAYRGRIGDILVTLDTGAIYIAGSASSAPSPATGVNASAAALNTAGALTTAAGATLTNSNNTLTSNANASLATALGRISVSVGALVLVVTGTAADGLWSITAVGSGAAVWVLDRPAGYRTWASLPALVAVESDLAGGQTVYALAGVTPTPTPGTTAIPYYRVDQVAATLAGNIKGSQLATAAIVSGGSAVPQIFGVDIADASNDYPLVLPYNCNLLQAYTLVDTVAATSSHTLRSAAGGGGTQMCGAIAHAVRGLNLEAPADAQTAFTLRNRVLTAGTYYVRTGNTDLRGKFYAQVIRG